MRRETSTGRSTSCARSGCDQPFFALFSNASVSRCGSTLISMPARSVCRTMIARESPVAPAATSGLRTDRPARDWPVASARSVRGQARLPTKRPCARAAMRTPAVRIYSAGTIGQRIERAATADGALTHGLPDRQRFNAGFHSHAEHFGRGGGGDVTVTVMHQFRDRPCTDRTDVAGLIADGREHGMPLLEHVLIAAAPDRELAG